MLAQHTRVEKAKKAKSEALARLWRWQLRRGGGTLQPALFCCWKAPQTGTGWSPANEVLGKENRELLSVFLPFEMLSLPTHKEIRNLSKVKESY